MVHVVVPAVDSSPASGCSSRYGDFADRSRSVGEIQSVNLLWRLIIEQQRTVATDRVAAETDKSARELSATMAATLGRIEEFDGDKEEWCQYQERLEHFC